jgi:hypothetical protein
LKQRIYQTLVKKFGAASFSQLAPLSTTIREDKHLPVYGRLG